MNILLLDLLERMLGKSKKENGNYYSFHSPFVEHHNPKLNIDLENGKWRCWKSGQSGSNIYSFLKKIDAEKKYYTELKLISPGYDDVYQSYLKNKSEEFLNKQKELPPEFKTLLDYKDSMSYKLALKYVKSRNITMSEIEYYNIGYCDSGYYDGHIIIPSYDVDYQLNYFVAREYLGSRYKNPPSTIFKLQDLVIFESNINWSFPINLTEGIFDAITMRRNTIPLLGKSLYPQLLTKLIVRGVEEVNLYLDSDVSFNEKYNIYKRLTSSNINCNIFNLTGKDINDIGYNNIKNETEIMNLEFDEIIKRVI